MSMQRIVAMIGVCASLAGCVSPNDDGRAGDRFPVPDSRREVNSEWQHSSFRPFSTYGMNESITSISLGSFAKGFHDLGTPQPSEDDSD